MVFSITFLSYLHIKVVLCPMASDKIISRVDVIYGLLPCPVTISVVKCFVSSSFFGFVAEGHVILSS